jgi:hypothetical protein
LANAKTCFFAKYQTKKAATAAFFAFLLELVGNDNQCEGNENNYNRNNDSQLRKQLIDRSTLCFAKEGLSTTGNRTGESAILCGLEKNHKRKRYGQNDEYDTQSEFHNFIPPKNISIPFLTWVYNHFSYYSIILLKLQ